jgi:hypothetical protein
MVTPLGKFLLICGGCNATELYVSYDTSNSNLMMAEGIQVLIVLELLAGC